MLCRLSSSPSGQWRRRSAQAAFTLVEIILAIGLATGLLVIAITFYHQASEMRGHILTEAERVTTVRLVLDRLANDLRAAQPTAASGNEFTGDETSMSFVKCAWTVLPANPTNGTSETTDLLRVSLTTLYATNGTQVVVQGLDRTETPLSLSLALSASDTVTNNATNSLDLSSFSDTATNLVTDPFAGLVRYVRFRYWDGGNWQSAWNNSNPPPGVEIILATDRLADDAEPDTFPPEPFRRVVFLPAGVAHPGAAPEATNSIPTFAAR